MFICTLDVLCRNHEYKSSDLNERTCVGGEQNDRKIIRLWILQKVRWMVMQKDGKWMSISSSREHYVKNNNIPCLISSLVLVSERLVAFFSLHTMMISFHRPEALRAVSCEATISNWLRLVFIFNLWQTRNVVATNQDISTRRHVISYGCN